MIRLSSTFFQKPRPFQSFDEMERMLSAYNHIYLKPKNGSLGNGIHKITYNRSTEEYYLPFQRQEQKNRLLKFKSLGAAGQYSLQKPKPGLLYRPAGNLLTERE